VHIILRLQVNVEYNLLDPLLRSTIAPEGDVNDTSGVWLGAHRGGGRLFCCALHLLA
jgi:hypothetical protein